ncbi:MAG: hypothetical protein J4G12_02900 [Gemmatimonadetes bacterium]|nr:hypothetical protein [Gemmatimonadota bacterium]
MSSEAELGGGSASANEALANLEDAVASLADAHTDLVDRLAAELKNASRLNRLLESQVGTEEPGSVLRNLEELQRENGELRARLDAGRAAIERTLARLRFLEEI